MDEEKAPKKKGAIGNGTDRPSKLWITQTPSVFAQNAGISKRGAFKKNELKTDQKLKDRLRENIFRIAGPGLIAARQGQPGTIRFCGV